MIPQLYTADQDGYVIERIGGLHQATSCTVTEELNGEFSLELSIPIGADHSNDLRRGMVIKARKDSMTDRLDSFVVKSVGKTLGDQISAYAVHESYRFNNVMVMPFLNGGSFHDARWAYTQAANNLVNRATGMHMYFELRDTSLSAINLVKPTSLRSFLLETLVQTYGGEFVFEPDNIIRWWEQRGEDRGARIVYGGNLQSLQVEEEEQDFETAIYPFYGSAGDENKPLVEIVGRILPYDMPFAPHTKIITVDFTSQFETVPSPAQLLKAAEQYRDQHRRSILPASLTVEVAEQQHDTPMLLGDLVTVWCPKIGVTEKRRIRKLTFDVLHERSQSVEVGDRRSTFTQTILGI